jgi:MoxR-like ATPase
MKWKNLLQVLSILAFLSSCQSEYERQVDYAKKLVEKERVLLNQMREMESVSYSYTALESIQKELSFRAHLSGNEELFNDQVANYRTSCEIQASKDQQLISKFP